MKPVMLCRNIGNRDPKSSSSKSRRTGQGGRTGVPISASIERRSRHAGGGQEAVSRGWHGRAGLNAYPRRYQLLGAHLFHRRSEEVTPDIPAGTARRPAVIHTDFERGFIRRGGSTDDCLCGGDQERRSLQAAPGRQDYTLRNGDVIHSASRLMLQTTFARRRRRHSAVWPVRCSSPRNPNSPPKARRKRGARRSPHRRGRIFVAREGARWWDAACFTISPRGGKPAWFEDFHRAPEHPARNPRGCSST